MRGFLSASRLVVSSSEDAMERMLDIGGAQATPGDAGGVGLTGEEGVREFGWQVVESHGHHGARAHASTFRDDAISRRFCG